MLKSFCMMGQFLRPGKSATMNDKRTPDNSGELYQDAFTENESKPRGAKREDAESSMQLDPNVDSQEADRMLKENRFGQNEPNRPA